MDIVIIANFCGRLDGESNSRFLELAAMLCREHQVEVVTTDFLHGPKQHTDKPSADYPFPITLLHESGYPKNVCLQRFASHHMFGRNVGVYLARRKKPDVIYAAVPSLTAPLEAARYCRRNDVRFVIDVQDLWPEAFSMVFPIPGLGPLLFTPFRSMADRIYAAADGICAVSRTYADRALSVNRKCQEGTVVYLGTRLAEFDAMRQNAPVVEKPAGEIWMGYVGTLSHSYDLTGTLDAMALLRRQGRCGDLRFVVMGDGPLREKFEAHARALDLPVTFTGMLPYSQMVPQLCACDFAVNPIMHGSAASIINKVGDYAAAGLAVINTQESPEYRALVTEYEMGINCENGNVSQLAEAMAQLTEEAELRTRLGAGNRRLAEEQFDRAATYGLLAAEILKTAE